MDEQFPYRLYGAQQDHGTVSISSASRPDMPWFAVGGTEAAHIAVDPLEPTSVWANAYWGEVTRIDTRTREVRPRIRIRNGSPDAQRGCEVSLQLERTVACVTASRERCGSRRSSSIAHATAAAPGG